MFLLSKLKAMKIHTGDLDIKINDIQYVSWKNWGYFG